MKKLEKLKEKTLDATKLGMIQGGKLPASGGLGEECTGGGVSNQFDYASEITYSFSWQSDTVENGIYVFSGGHTTITHWSDCPPNP